MSRTELAEKAMAFNGKLALETAEALQEGIIATDLSGKIILANSAAERILGVDDPTGADGVRDPLVGIYEEDKVTPMPPSENLLAKALQGISGSRVVFVRHSRKRMGSFVHMTGSPVRDHAGRVIGGVTILRDCTAERLAGDRIKFLANLGRDVITGTDLASTCREALNELAQLSRWPLIELWTASEDTEAMVFESLASPPLPDWIDPEELRRWEAACRVFTLAPGLDVVGQAWSTREVVEVDDLSKEDQFVGRGNAAALGLTSATAVPIVAQGRVVAVFVIYHEDAATRAEPYLTLIRLVADQLGTLARRLAEERRLRTSEERLRTIFYEAPIGVVTLSSDMRIVAMNRRFGELLEYGTSDLTGQDFGLFVQPGQKGLDMVTGFERTEGATETESTVEVLLRTRTGGTRWADVSFRRMAADKDHPSTWLVMIKDNTERHIRLGQIQEAREVAEASTLAKSSFVSHITHEIRTPLNAILGSAELLGLTTLDAHQSELLRTMTTAGEVLVSEINDILDFSKLEAHRMDIDHSPFTLSQVLEESLEMVASRASERGLYLGYRLDPALPARWMGDAVHIRQVLLNLLSNAVKFTEKGRVVLEVRKPAPTLAGAETPGLEFLVRDTGQGIPEEKIGLLFQDFAQVPGTHETYREGTGLGLAISRRLTEAMGGRISVVSRRGEGSTFRVALPLKPASTERSLPVPAATRELLARHLLVMTDDDDLSGWLQEKAISWGLAVETVRTPDEVVSRLQGASRYEAVLCGPVWGGAATPLVRKLRNLPVDQRPGLIVARSRRAVDIAPPPVGDDLSVVDVSLPLKETSVRDAILRIVAPALIPTAPPAQKAEVLTSLGHDHPLTILVAEDNPVNQKVIRQLLASLGYSDITMVSDGSAAVQECRRIAYDLVFMDLGMPVLGGLEATVRLRTLDLPGGKQPKIVALTAHGSGGSRDRCLNGGMDDYLSKPVRLQDLSRVLLETVQNTITDRGVAKRRTVNEPVVDPNNPPASLDRLQRISTEEPSGFVLELLKAFLEESRRGAQAIGEAWERRDARRLSKEAHRLKSSAAELDAVRLSEIAAELERQASDGTREVSGDLVAELGSELETVLDGVELLLGQISSSAPHEASVHEGVP